MTQTAMIELPRYARNIQDLEAEFLLNLYNYPWAGIKQFFDVEPQGQAREWDGAPPDKYQSVIEAGGRRVLIDQYQIGAICDIRSKRQEDFCGRGIGKSMYDLGLKCAYWGVVLPYADQAIYGTKKPMGVRFVLTGNNIDTAKQLIGYIKNFIGTHPLFAGEIDPDSDSKLLLKLKNGTEYHVRAASDAARGLNPFSFLSERLGTIVGRTIVVCDEFAYVVDQTFWNEVVEPYLSLGMSGFWAATTPNGKENAAYTCSLDADFVVRRFPSWLNKYRDLAELLKIKRRLLAAGYPEIYNEEYEGIPQDQKYRYFSAQLVGVCHMLFPIKDDEPLLWDDAYIAENAARIVREHGELYLGCDPNKGKMESGQAADASAIVIVEARRSPDRLITRYAMEWGNTESSRPECRNAISTGDLIDKIRWLYHVLKIRYGKIDINPGKAYLEALKFEKNGLPPVYEKSQIDYIDTDSTKVSQLADELVRTKMEERAIGIPPHTDLQRALSRYGTQVKRTGAKRTDLIKALVYAHVAATERGMAVWAPGASAAVERSVGAATADRMGRAVLDRTMTSAGTGTLTSAGTYGTIKRRGAA